MLQSEQDITRRTWRFLRRAPPPLVYPMFTWRHARNSSRP